MANVKHLISAKIKNCKTIYKNLVIPSLHILCNALFRQGYDTIDIFSITFVKNTFYLFIIHMNINFIKNNVTILGITLCTYKKYVFSCY